MIKTRYSFAPIKKLIEQKGISQVQLSRSLGLSHSAVSVWARIGIPNDGVVMKIAHLLGVDFREILVPFEVTEEDNHGDSEIIQTKPVSSQIKISLPINTEEHNQRVDFVLVDMLGVRAACGYGECNGEVYDVEQIAVPRSWFPMIRLRAEYIKMLRITGDSMSPSINDGDMAMVDISDRQIRDNRIYVVRKGDELQVKRLFKRYDGSIEKRSDNRSYDVEVVPKEVVGAQFEVIGRVVWTGKVWS
jgi:phage repressor protein C with HTH and peptisase S24 domain